MKQREHYYYVCRIDGRLHIIKSWNKKEMRKQGVQESMIIARYNSFYDAAVYCSLHGEKRPIYTNLTDVDFIK